MTVDDRDWPKAALLLALLAIVGGCATTQVLHITSTPPGAFVLVNGERVAVTPADIEARKNPTPLITVEKDSFAPKAVKLERGIDPAACLYSLGSGILIGAGIYLQSANTLGSWDSKGTIFAAGCGTVAGAGGFLCYSTVKGMNMRYSRTSYDVILERRQE
jgi:hypothetical protein